MPVDYELRQPLGSRLRRSGPHVLVLTLLAALLVFALVLGRTDPATNSGADPGPNRGMAVGQQPGRQLLQEMNLAYAAAKSYHDRTRLRVTYRQSGEWVEDVAELVTTLARPDRFLLEVSHGDRRFRLQVADGRIVGWIRDPTVPGLSHQVVARPVTNQITLATLMESLELRDPATSSEGESVLATLPVPLSISPLTFLLDAHALDRFLSSATDIEQIESSTYQGQPVERVRVQSPGGSFVFWLDRESQLLRRIDYPTPDTTGPEAPRDATMLAEISDCVVDQEVPPGTFARQPDSDAILVHYFVLPPSLEMPALLGTELKGLHFTDLWGESVDETKWHDRLAVLIWFNRHPSSFGVLTEVEELADRATIKDDVSFLAICAEPSTELSHGDVMQLARNWRLTIPVVRDLDAVGRDLLGIEHAPTLALLDREGTLQLLEQGGDTHLDRELEGALDRLRRGEDLSQSYRERIEATRQAFERALAASRAEANNAR